MLSVPAKTLAFCAFAVPRFCLSGIDGTAGTRALIGLALYNNIECAHAGLGKNDLFTSMGFAHR